MASEMLDSFRTATYTAPMLRLLAVATLALICGCDNGTEVIIPEVPLYDFTAVVVDDGSGRGLSILRQHLFPSTPVCQVTRVLTGPPAVVIYECKANYP